MQKTFRNKHNGKEMGLEMPKNTSSPGAWASSCGDFQKCFLFHRRGFEGIREDEKKDEKRKMKIPVIRKRFPCVRLKGRWVTYYRNL